jgi:BirA family biotin operon repressor/biotin-[acetyl-CoA-carboxylase] ligase
VGVVSQPFISRLDRFGSIESTQPVVRQWLEEGTPEVCLAVADEQTQGRGRLGRTWAAPPGAALLVSAGFRPIDLPARHAWRLGATVALAMLDAAEDVAGLRDATLGLKWPNDIVVDGPDGLLRKVAGVLGEAQLDDDRVETAVVGIGVNADWAATDFPPDLVGSMDSLRELSGGRPIDREALLEAWVDRLEPRYSALTVGRFDSGAWSARQRTTGELVEVDSHSGRINARALGVDPETGSLLLAGAAGAPPTVIDAGDVTRCRVISGLGTLGRR